MAGDTGVVIEAEGELVGEEDGVGDGDRHHLEAVQGLAFGAPLVSPAERIVGVKLQHQRVGCLRGTAVSLGLVKETEIDAVFRAQCLWLRVKDGVESDGGRGKVNRCR